MNLKESYHYANYLDGLLNTGYRYLRSPDFVMTKREEHLKSKANPDAEDETIYVQKEYDVDFTPNQVIDLIVKVLDERESLAKAITKAKTGTEINID
jgi:hypothetical protein